MMWMPRLVAVSAWALFLAACQGLGAGTTDAPLFKDLGQHSRPVRTESTQTQRFFNQGLTLAYGFNHSEAARSFSAAASLDPDCAMAWWGLAWVLGPNINKEMDPADYERAHRAAQRALETADTAEELAWARAISARYSATPPSDRSLLDEAFARGMKAVVQAYPADMDAATIYAEALMDLSPWEYWSKEGEPLNHTQEIVEVLEGVLQQAPNHPGALHYYIHAVEASRNPGRAEWCADRLGGLVPGAGHLVHMPAHIYIRIGRYHDASEANLRAAAADESYISQCRVQGFYPAAYYPHNIHFLWASAQMEGRAELAIESARRVVRAIDSEMVDEVPALEEFLPTPFYALARFARWEELLAQPEPPAQYPFTLGMYDHAVGLAHVAKGQLSEAYERQKRLARSASSAAMEELVMLSGASAADLLALADLVLQAEIAKSEGRVEVSFALLKRAIEAQDALPYSEPPPFYFPIRQLLGHRQLEAGLAAEAEATFLRELEDFPHNGWSLSGLERALREQGRELEADDVRDSFERAWAMADVKLGPGSACCGAAGANRDL